MAASARAGLWCGALLVAAPLPARAAAPASDVTTAAPSTGQVTAFRQALADYDAGRFDDARAALEALAESNPDRAGVWFWLARAARASGDTPRAQDAVERALALDPASPDAHYLAALVSWEAGRRADAAEHLDAVVAASPDSELGQAAAAERARLDWLERRDQVSSLVAAGDATAALDLLATLDAERPGDAGVNRLMGKLLAQQGRSEEALARLDAALSVEPDHAWTRYWRAVALQESGRQDEAHDLFEAIAAGDDPDVAAAAARRLETRTGGGEGDEVLDWRVSLGWALDTNPAFVSDPDQQAANSELATGWTASASAEWRPLRWDGGVLRVAPAIALRDYVAGPAGSDYGQAGLGVELDRYGEHLRGWVGAGASVALLAWSPYLDREQLTLGGAWQPTDWLQPRVELSGFRRAAHQANYDNLDAWGALAEPAVRVLPLPWLRVELGWALAAEQAQPYTVAWTGLTGDAGDIPYDAELSANASFRGHGPTAALRLRPLDGALEIDGSAAYTWRRYADPEQVDYVIDGQVYPYAEDRRDRRLWASAAAGVHLTGPLWLRLRYAASVNRSTLTADVWPADRSFDRHLAIAGVELRR